MHGFKSFAKKEILKLSEGVTTVVGPNGCGKTNIVDAIRWVLGEQRSTVLRGGKMEDVIFNGAEGIRPLSVCDVTLTVHNNKGKLPIEFSDIEIGRRVYRNGESEYSLNKTPCRLKDINDLFIDTGMGSDAYSVIELKMIEQILSENGDDRRRMFEEASGINKYRKQRKSTLRKFDATRFDLERINDVIAEVEQKVHGLELQLKRFKRHEKLTDDLKVKDIELAFLKVDRYKSIMMPLEKEIVDFNYLKSTNSNESSAHEKELESQREIYDKQENELNLLQKDMAGLSESQQELRQNILVWVEKGRSSLMTIDRGNIEHANNKERIILLGQNIKEYNKETERIQDGLDKHLILFKEEKSALDNIEVDYQEKVKILDKVQNDRWTHERKMANDRSLFDRTSSLLEEKKKTYDLVTTKISNQLEQSDKYKKSIEILDSEHNIIEKELTKEKKVLIKTESNFDDLILKKDDLTKEVNNVLVQKATLEDQTKFYEELIETNEGFPEGTQYVLEHSAKFSGILGTIADLFQVDEKYRNALETGLGDLAHCLIAKNKTIALDTLQKAIKEGAGDLTIIPMKEVISLNIETKKIPENKNIIARASEIIKTDKNSKSLAEYILGNLLIVDDIKKAATDNSLSGWALVDLNGTYSGSDFIIKNRQISDHGNVIGRKKKLEIMGSDYNKVESKVIKISDELDKINKMILRVKETLDTSRNSVMTKKEKLSEIEGDLMRNHLKQSQVLENISVLKAELNELEKTINDSNKSLKKIKPNVEKSEKVLIKYKNRIDDASSDVTKTGVKRDRQQQILQEARIEIVNIESSKDNLSFKIVSANEQIKELESRQISILNDKNQLIESKKQLDVKIKDGEKGLEKMNAELHKQKSIIDLKQSVYRETYNNIDKIQTKIKLEQKDRESLLENLKVSEFKLSDLKQKIDIIKEKIKERHGENIPDEMIVDDTEEELSFSVEKMQRSLENIGPVNMAVQDEYNEDVERLDHLRKQRDDLINSEDNLRETIQKIDRIARKKFQETFKLINQNYEKLFNLFFEGGQGHLRLVGDPDPLEADIIIDAQPPGKRNTSLRLLSSGEKALTAISLLFSIYQVKPSPYCILDEVDAPLDDVNIHKFTKVLKQFADETQFIIVTHNKLTMEIANHMYGVTQEKKGISKLVSVSFK
mgnify:FL=1